MVSEHNNHSDQKDFFLKGYNELLRRIQPEKVICYNEPFPEMQGDIVLVDYDLSSWRYMNDDPYVPSKYMSYITGEKPLPPNSEIIIKSGMVIQNDVLLKGMGSTYGGVWKPAKSEEERFLGEPGEIKISYDKKENRIDTKIGEDGRAIRERHYSDHNKPWAHSSPHDHEIRWDNPTRHPDPQGPINYWENNIPEFKKYGRWGYMKATVVQTNSFEENRFKTISDFKDCMRRHGEVEFEWNGKNYSITHPDQISISEANKQETEKICINADEVLEYKVGDVRLRDVITQVTVWSRTI